MATPRYHTTPGGSTHPIVFNPFENQLLDKLKTHSPMFSPNMFKVTEPGSAEKVGKYVKREKSALFRRGVRILSVHTFGDRSKLK